MVVETNWSNMTSLQNVMTEANRVTGDWFWAGINFMIFFVLLLSSMAFGFEASILVASFISLLVALFLAYMGLVTWKIVAIFVGAIMFTIMYMAWNRND